MCVCVCVCAHGGVSASMLASMLACVGGVGWWASAQVCVCAFVCVCDGVRPV